MKWLCSTALMAVLIPAFAETGPAVEWIQSGDHLSNGGASWHGEELRLSAPLAPRSSVDGTLRRASRFDLSDSQIEINFAFPFSERLTGAVTASDSPTHHFLPKTDIGASLQYGFAPGWLLNAGSGRTEYDNASISKATLGIERYFSVFRAVLTWRPSRVDGVSANGADMRLDYYYGDRDFIGVQAASGKEAANVDGRGVTISTVHSAGLVGRHGLDRNWTLRYGIEKVKQGGFYNRTGIRFGAQYAF